MPREPDVARATQQSVLRHLWYLTEETVVFALLDPDTCSEEKAQMSQKLLAQPRPDSFMPGKPHFPRPSVFKDGTLASFVGPHSWLLMDLLGGCGGWLLLHPSQWSADEEFRRLRTVVKELVIVNDAAERGVKDIQDYANAARDGERRGRIVTVVSSHHAAAPTLTKQELKKAVRRCEVV